jgi:hypothetical protein
VIGFTGEMEAKVRKAVTFGAVVEAIPLAAERLAVQAANLTRALNIIDVGERAKDTPLRV